MSSILNHPWAVEPDRKEWTAHGLPCVIIRRSFGHLCGYVGVPASHPAYGTDYASWGDDNPLSAMEVHGGVTYTEEGEGNYLPAGYWWIGFDCAHFGDRTPLLEVRFGLRRDGTYRDMDYVTAQTEHLAQQLAALVSGEE